MFGALRLLSRQSHGLLDGNRHPLFGQGRDDEGALLRTLTDAEVIAACAVDPERFREIFERHYVAILAYLRRRIGTDLADDLAVDTFVVAFHRSNDFDLAHESARPWLFGIATNLLRHHRRTERRQLLAYARAGRDPTATVDPGLDAVDRRLDGMAVAPILAEALAGLPARYRDVLLLFAWGDLSHEEIAAAIGVPVGTVRSRLSRARRRIRELLIASGQVFSDDHG
jgi:RNA polymerase sigma factor (sigma-70 family)